MVNCIISKNEINENILEERRIEVKNKIYMKDLSGINNCFQTAVINLFSYYSITENNLSSEYKKLLKIQNKKNEDACTDYFKIPYIIKEYMKNKDVKYRLKKFLFTKNNFFDYKKNIDNNIPVLAHLSLKEKNFGHSVLIIGYAITKNRKYLIALTGKEDEKNVYIPFIGMLDGIQGYAFSLK